ncbi:hypothetical protein DFJ74DRAFT_201583 [Hyaloraphidium curvatum]|nr:hypothetical protein DFJ74DRAFT_201583 [Hyaloraphidium curvatum]
MHVPSTAVRHTDQMEYLLVPYRIVVFLRAWYSYYVYINVFTLFLFAFDKFLGRAGLLRVPEAALHMATLCGGIIGAWLGMAVFRHKTRKTSFRNLYRLCSIAHGLVMWAFVAT